MKAIRWIYQKAQSTLSKLVKAPRWNPEAMNACACMIYNRETGFHRFTDGGDLALYYWQEAVRLGNEAAKENINKLIRRG